MAKTSRRRFGKTLAALTAVAPAAAQEKKQASPAQDDATPPPCSVNPGLADYEIPRSTEPSFTFKP